MKRTIKLTEEELHNIIKKKINEAVAKLGYSPAIGNKKRGPGDDIKDQMTKRKNTKLDEDIDERDIIRRFPDGYEDYDGDDGVGDSSNGKYTVTLDADSYAYAFKEVYGRVPENLSDILEENDFPEEVDVGVSLKVDYDPGDRDTPPSHNVDIENWEIDDDYIMSGFNGEFRDVIAKAVDYEMERAYPDDVYDSINESKVRLTQSQLCNYISESVQKVLSKILRATGKRNGGRALNEISSNLYDRAADKAFNDMMQNFNDYPTKSKRERQWKNFRNQARIRGGEEKNAVCPSVDERDLPNMPAGTYVVMDGDGRDAISANFRTRYSGHAGTKEQCEEYVDRFYDKGANWEYLPEIVPLEQYLKNKR